MCARVHACACAGAGFFFFILWERRGLQDRKKSGGVRGGEKGGERERARDAGGRREEEARY